MPHHHHRQRPKPQHSNFDRALESLRLLRETNNINTVDDLIRALENMGEPAMVMAEFVGTLQRELAPRSLDVDVAMAANRAYATLIARDEHDGLIAGCIGLRIGLLLPLPPHVYEEFRDAPNVTLMVAPGHKPPPHLRGMNYISRPREISQLLDQFDVIVFEGFEENDTLFVEAGVAAVLDPRLIPVTTRLLVHLRPHMHNDDDVFDLGGRPINCV